MLKKKASVVLAQNVFTAASMSQLVMSVAQELPGVFTEVVKMGRWACLADNMRVEATGSFLKGANREQVLSLLLVILQLRGKRSEMKEAMSTEKLGLLPEVHSRIAVLKNLLYIDENEMVTLKGRCCCYVDATDLGHT